MLFAFKLKPCKVSKLGEIETGNESIELHSRLYYLRKSCYLLSDCEDKGKLILVSKYKLELCHVYIIATTRYSCLTLVVQMFCILKHSLQLDSVLGH